MKVIEKMSGRKIVRADTSGEKLAEKQVRIVEARIVELRYKAVSRLRGQLMEVLTRDITQIGCEGFYWKHGRSVIPIFEPWGEATVAENRRIFNAHT